MARALPEEMDGVLRRRLREAILALFDRFDDVQDALTEQGIDIPVSKVDDGPNLEARVKSLLKVCYQKGVIEQVCEIMAQTAKDMPPVYKEFNEVKKEYLRWQDEYLKLRLTVVVSSIGTDEQFKRNFLAPDQHLRKSLPDNDGFLDPLEPCDLIDTYVRFRESRANARSILRDIKQAHVFAAFVSGRSVEDEQLVAEFECGLKSLWRAVPSGEQRPRIIAIALDEKSRDWINKKIAEADPLPPNSITIEDFFEGNRRKSIVGSTGAGKRIVDLAKSLRQYFDGPAPDEELSPPPPLPNLELPSSDTIVLLGEPKRARPEITSGACPAMDELADELTVNGIPHEAWGDGWRETPRDLDFLNQRPLFIRAVNDSKPLKPLDLLTRLSSELNVTFGFDFDEEGDGVQAIAARPKVLWRPNGPAWDPQETGPLLFSRNDHPSELAQWLGRQLGIDVTGKNNAIVCYEDPVDKGDFENQVRRVVVEQSLRDAIALKEPPVRPDSLPFGYQQLQEIIDSIRGNRLTVIAAHDMRSVPGSGEDTLQRYRDIDRRIDESLARNRAEDAPLMRVAVLLRNWQLFPALEFSRNSRVSKWQLLRIKYEDGKFVADSANMDRLREHAAEIVTRRSEHPTQ